LGPPERFVVRDGDTLFVVRNGISVHLLSAWASRFRPLVFDADFSHADENYFPQYVQWDFVDSLSTDSTATYVIYYDFSIDACCAEGEPTYPLPITVLAQDRGCGETLATLWIEMDNVGPPGSPVLSAVPAVTTEATLAVSGQAPEGSHRASLTIEHTDADSTTTLAALELDAARTFSTTVPLLAGENLIRAYGTDAAGNRSEASAAQSVRLVTTETQITVPNPFHAGDRFVLEDRTGYASVAFEVYNLEGDRIRRWAFSTGIQQYAAAVWDGRNGSGESVRQGPYLLRIETRDPAGRTREEVRAFVFQR
jgi:hypothetical protein